MVKDVIIPFYLFKSVLMCFLYAHLKLMQSYYTDNTLLMRLLILNTAPSSSDRRRRRVNEGQESPLYSEKMVVWDFMEAPEIYRCLFIKIRALHGIPAPPTLAASSPLLLTRIPAPPRERWVGAHGINCSFFYEFETSDYFHGAWITNM
ncbi:hypothetical protein METP3_01046 [Methanosarcinales archaeon]|nr:hypothetical protein METP3_01046 [Methanosarcinales archaeon]